MSDKLSHVSESGEARMVDVSAKAETHRVARATGSIRMERATLVAIVTAQVKKGDVLGVARIAGVMAAKKTADLIPLCHPLALTDVHVELTPDDSLPGIRAEATVKTTGRTGVEMEALTAVSVALLTVYDMAKALDRGMTISDISLAQKSGGVGGEYSRVDGTGPAPYPSGGSTKV
jgi:cyclic pyranopterin phosphate synthase